MACSNALSFDEMDRLFRRYLPEDFPVLGDDLAEVIDAHKDAIISYAEAENGWPLRADDWGVEQVMWFTLGIAERAFCDRLTASWISELKQRHRLHQQAAGLIKKAHGRKSPEWQLLSRRPWPEAVSQTQRKPPSTSKLFTKLRNFLELAGLPRDVAARHARKIQKSFVDDEPEKARKHNIELIEIMLEVRRKHCGDATGFFYTAKDLGYGDRWSELEGAKLADGTPLLQAKIMALRKAIKLLRLN